MPLTLEFTAKVEGDKISRSDAAASALANRKARVASANRPSRPRRGLRETF
jgi:hypothetical protein